jgi:hypothetical protein
LAGNLADRKVAYLARPMVVPSAASTAAWWAAWTGQMSVEY